MFLLPVLFKGKIMSEIEKQTANYLNAKLSIGNVSLSLFRSFPDMNLQISNFSMAGIEKFEKDTLIQFDDVSIDLNLMSVISGTNIEIKEIILTNPQILAKVLADNSANWDILKTDTTAVEEETNDASTNEPSAFKMALQNVEIRNGSVVYDDATFDFRYEMLHFEYQLSGDMTLSQAVLQNNLTNATISVIMENIPYLNRATVNLDSKIQANLDSMKFVFQENKASVNQIMLAFDGFVAMPDDDIEMNITYSSTETSFKSVLSLVPAIYMNDFAGLQTSGEFDLEGFVKGIYNDTTLPAFGVNLAVRNGHIQYPDLPKSIDNISMQLEMENKGGSGDDNVVNLKQFHMEMAKNPFDAYAYVLTTATDVAVDSKINGKLDLGSINQIIPLDSMTIAGLLDANVELGGKLSDLENENYQAFKADGGISLNGFQFAMTDLPYVIQIPAANMLFSPQNIDLQQLDVKIGESDFHLAGRIDNLLAYALKDETLKAQFNYRSFMINANQLMANSSNSTETQAPENQTADTAAMEAPIIPKNIHFTLKTAIGKVLYDKMVIENISGMIILENGNALLNNVVMNMLKGQITASGSYKTQTPETPSANFQLAIQQIDIPETFNTFNSIQKLAPIAQNATGAVSLNMLIATNMLPNMSPIYESINGSGRLTSENITLTNNTLFGKIADATKLENWRSPKLENIDLKFTIENGEIKIEPTTLNIAQTAVNIEGVSRLNSEIDFLIGTKLPGRLAGNITRKLPENFKPESDIDIQIVVGGTVTEPKIEKINSSALETVTDIVKQELSEKAKEYLKTVQEKADKLMAEAHNKANIIKNEANESAKKINDEADKQAQNIIAEANKKALQLKQEADKQAQKLVNEANNPIAKKMAEKAGAELKEKADKTGKKLVSEATEKANNLKNSAKEKSNAIKNKANQTADKIVNDAQKQSDSMMKDANTKAQNM